jgi:hypothetical protein
MSAAYRRQQIRIHRRRPSMNVKKLHYSDSKSTSIKVARGECGRTA